MNDRGGHEGVARNDHGRCWPGCCDDRPEARAADELRCECGCLLARRVKDGIELKCRRCRRIFVISLTGGAWTPLTRIRDDSVRELPEVRSRRSGGAKPAGPRSV